MTSDLAYCLCDLQFTLFVIFTYVFLCDFYFVRFLPVICDIANNFLVICDQILNDFDQANVSFICFSVWSVILYLFFLWCVIIYPLVYCEYWQLTLVQLKVIFPTNSMPIHDRGNYRIACTIHNAHAWSNAWIYCKYALEQDTPELSQETWVQIHRLYDEHGEYIISVLCIRHQLYNYYYRLKCTQHQTIYDHIHDRMCIVSKRL